MSGTNRFVLIILLQPHIYLCKCKSKLVNADMHRLNLYLCTDVSKFSKTKSGDAHGNNIIWCHDETLPINTNSKCILVENNSGKSGIIRELNQAYGIRIKCSTMYEKAPFC